MECGCKYSTVPLYTVAVAELGQQMSAKRRLTSARINQAARSRGASWKEEAERGFLDETRPLHFNGRRLNGAHPGRERDPGRR